MQAFSDWKFHYKTCRRLHPPHCLSPGTHDTILILIDTNSPPRDARALVWKNSYQAVLTVAAQLHEATLMHSHTEWKKIISNSKARNKKATRKGEAHRNRTREGKWERDREGREKRERERERWEINNPRDKSPLCYSSGCFLASCGGAEICRWEGPMAHSIGSSASFLYIAANPLFFYRAASPWRYKYSSCLAVSREGREERIKDKWGAKKGGRGARRGEGAGWGTLLRGSAMLPSVNALLTLFELTSHMILCGGVTHWCAISSQITS